VFLKKKREKKREKDMKKNIDAKKVRKEGCIVVLSIANFRLVLALFTYLLYSYDT
jgi:hypothetical protein